MQKCTPILPSPDNIYYKDFHFLDEPLIKRKYPGASSTSEIKNDAESEAELSESKVQDSNQTPRKVSLEQQPSKELITPKRIASLEELKEEVKSEEKHTHVQAPSESPAKTKKDSLIDDNNSAEEEEKKI